MKPPSFRYVAAHSVDEAVAVLRAEGDEAKVLAGGQSLMPMLNFRLVRPSVLVDINRIGGLGGVQETPDGVRIGALTRHSALQFSPLVRRHFPLIAAAMEHVAHLAVRNRGTTGGSLSHADPAAELPMLARLLRGRIHTRSASGERVHDADAFFVAALTTVLRPDEMVTAIDLPFLPAGTGWGFEEHARRHGDFALACVAVTLDANAGRMRHVRIAMMGVGDRPLRAEAAEAILEDGHYAPATLAAAVQAVREAVQPNTDLHASADYRRHLVGVLAGRAMTAAWQRAAAGTEA
jgi:CO/xanthine dehydrogenase FAD-binding subunit